MAAVLVDDSRADRRDAGRATLVATDCRARSHRVDEGIALSRMAPMACGEALQAGDHLRWNLGRFSRLDGCWGGSWAVCDGYVMLVGRRAPPVDRFSDIVSVRVSDRPL